MKSSTLAMGTITLAAHSALASPQYGSGHTSAMAIGSACPSATEIANSCFSSSGLTSSSMDSGNECGAGLKLCQVIDPTRKEAPWAGSSHAFPQCYDPVRFVCSSNFLCPVNAPKIFGKYACCPNIASKTSATAKSASSSSGTPSAPLSISVNAPGAGDIDGILGFDFIVDVTIDATDAASNGLIPFKPLFQDVNSSTFGPGSNGAFPGLVVLQNTTAKKGPLMGPTTNLAGLFQLNGVAKVNGLNQYNAIWIAGAPLFGIGPSELVVYYVKEKAEKEMSLMPEASDRLISNVVKIPFNISNRSTIAVPPKTPHCTNGAVLTENNATTPAGMPQISAQIFNPHNGDIVGVNGSGWVLDLLFDANSATANSLISGSAGYESGFVSITSPAFKPGPNSLLPGLVVLLNTTISGKPFSGPGTNLAGLFQINNLRTVNCDTIIEIWSEWLVGKPIAGHGPSQINVFLVQGTAPAVITDTSNLTSRSDLISGVSSVDIILS